MGELERIAILDASGGEVSHLAVRRDEPETAPAPLTLLYLHGFGSNQEGEKAEFFRRRALAAGLAFCSFDFQGHGRSGGSMLDLTLSRNLADLALVHRLLRERGHRRIALVGSSMGGGTALWYSALNPRDVAAGLHIAPALELERALLDWAGPERTRTWRETGSIHFRNDLVSCELGWGLIDDLKAHRVSELMECYRTPALLLQGKRDDSVPWRSVLEFTVHCAYNGIELHLFADGDHRLTDRLARLWELMLEFLRGRGLLIPAT
jgi:pimeloyl-ACP methyl ester carboxylesterase